MAVNITTIVVTTIVVNITTMFASVTITSTIIMIIIISSISTITIIAIITIPQGRAGGQSGGRGNTALSLLNLYSSKGCPGAMHPTLKLRVSLLRTSYADEY